MSDEDIVSPSMPGGYFYHQPSIDRVQSEVAVACSAGPGITGAAQRLRDQGIHYWNLTAFAAKLISKGDFVHSHKRNVIDCGADGKVLQPLGQITGTCVGCGASASVELSWATRYVLSGDVPMAEECSLTWSYLAGRDLSIVPHGDSGAIPAITAETFMKVGMLPVSKSGQWNLMELPPNGQNSQESIAIRLRDTPMLPQDLCSAATPYKCNVYSPRTADDAADCIASGRSLSTASTYQIRETTPGSDGISPLYQLGGHQTMLSGIAWLKGRLIFLKTESWWNVLYPGSKWPNHRVVLHTDDGPKTLYPGQGAVYADQWIGTRPEMWAYDSPGIVCN